jgi:hypothetical protein
MIRPRSDAQEALREARLRTEGASLLLAAGLLGELDLELAVEGALRLLERSCFWLEMAA